MEDTGCGIAEQDLEHIFDRFYRSGDEMTRTGQGTGLGLPICYGIVEKMGGKITVESEIEKGTTFTVSIPREGPEGVTGVEREDRGVRS